MFECRGRNCGHKVRPIPSQGNELGASYSRELDVLDRLFLWKDPLLPARVAVGHASEDDLGHFQTGLSQANFRRAETALEYDGEAQQGKYTYRRASTSPR